MLHKCCVLGSCITAKGLSQSSREIESSEETYSGAKAALVLYLLWHNAGRRSATRDGCLRGRRMTLHFGLWVEKEGIVPSDWRCGEQAHPLAAPWILSKDSGALFPHTACADRCCSTPALCWPLHAHDLCFTSVRRSCFVVHQPTDHRLWLNFLKFCKTNRGTSKMF